jgi:hypothetical protein
MQEIRAAVPRYFRLEYSPLIGLSGDYAIGNTRVYPLYVWAHGSPFIGPFYSGVGEPIFTKRRGAAGGLCAQSDMRVRKSAPEATPPPPSKDYSIPTLNHPGTTPPRNRQCGFCTCGVRVCLRNHPGTIQEPCRRTSSNVFFVHAWFECVCGTIQEPSWNHAAAQQAMWFLRFDGAHPVTY